MAHRHPPSSFSFPENALPTMPLRPGAGTACLAVLALAACTSAPPRISVPPDVPPAFRHAVHASVTPAAASRDAWWTVFQDPTLDELQASAARGNTGLQAAAARLAKARALARAAGAGRWPQLAVHGGAGRQGGPLINAIGGEGTLATVAADLSYEVDLFGRLQQAADAATLDAVAQQSLLRDVQLLVQAEVAQNYLALRALDGERALVADTAAAYRESAVITGRRYRSGSVSELEWVRAQAELAAIESEALALDARRAGLEHALALLAGEPAARFALPQREWNAALPVVPAGLPASVLARRPDVAAAQRSLQAAQARSGLARNAWLPTLTLTASGGTASPDLGNLLQASMRTWSVAGLLGAVLFDGGRRDAAIEAAGAELQEAVAAYHQRILVALREVDDELAAVQLLAGQARSQSAAVALGSRASLLAQSRYRSGLASQLDVLDALRTELRHRRQALQVRGAQYQATVRLIRALGGAWDPSPSS
jgi:multidrug efflux system outer membrane protein